MIFLLGGLSLLVLWVGGTLFLGLAGLRDRSAPANPAAAFAAGVSLLAVLGMTTVVLGGHLTLLAGYALFAAVAAAHLAWRPRPSWPSWPTWPRLRTGRRADAVLAATALLLSLLGVAAARDRLLWDGWALWTFKARVLFLEGTLPPALLDPAGPYSSTQPSYPLALPLVHWWGYAHAGGAFPALASVAGAACLLFVPLVLWRNLRRPAGPPWAAAAAFGCAAFWPMTRYAIGGYADVLITLAILGAVVELDRGLDGGLDDGLGGARQGAAGRYAIFLTLGALAKNEGLALAAVGALAGLPGFATGGTRRARDARWLLAPFLAIAPWFVFTRLRGAGAAHLGAVPSPAEVLSRVPTLVGAFVDLVTTPAWLPLLLLFACGLLARVARRDHRGGPAWSLVLGYFAITQAVYLATPLELPWLVATSLDRVIGTMVPALVFLSIREICRLGEGVATAEPLHRAVSPELARVRLSDEGQPPEGALGRRRLRGW